MTVDLNIRNFAYFAFDQNSELLTKGDRSRALALLILGICTLGVGFISGVIYARKKPQITDLLARISAAAKNTFSLWQGNGPKNSTEEVVDTKISIWVKSLKLDGTRSERAKRFLNKLDNTTFDGVEGNYYMQLAALMDDPAAKAALTTGLFGENPTPNDLYLMKSVATLPRYLICIDLYKD